MTVPHATAIICRTVAVRHPKPQPKTIQLWPSHCDGSVAKFGRLAHTSERRSSAWFRGPVLERKHFGATGNQASGYLRPLVTLAGQWPVAQTSGDRCRWNNVLGAPAEPSPVPDDVPPEGSGTSRGYRDRALGLKNGRSQFIRGYREIL